MKTSLTKRRWPEKNFEMVQMVVRYNVKLKKKKSSSDNNNKNVKEDRANGVEELTHRRRSPS
ncbi:hypothetical protein T11_10495 [Trichinella zimbabwensis]|uniref:Uncharacterized protein n=1 Tax=Trichinella zimbabwensis TaxID=268475 RepID=A0A0V1H8D3_9BILA|nr:hypothetical protein T11_10495 [Trichinella zimbabwensis]